MEEFITLSCPSCGAKLEITPDIDRFACGHCGKEHIVKRKGGMVSLSPVVDAIRGVQTGVDKTAAELGIVRLQKEIEEIQAKRNDVLNHNTRPSAACSVVLLTIGFFIISFGLLISYGTSISSLAGLFVIGGVLLVVGLLPLILLKRNQKVWDDSTGKTIKTLEEQYDLKMQELQRLKQTVAS
jgi:hypothetical protein